MCDDLYHNYMTAVGLPSQQLVEDTAEREPVGREGVLDTLLDDLRSHVTMGTTGGDQYTCNGHSLGWRALLSMFVGDVSRCG